MSLKQGWQVAATGALAALLMSFVTAAQGQPPLASHELAAPGKIGVTLPQIQQGAVGGFGGVQGGPVQAGSGGGTAGVGNWVGGPVIMCDLERLADNIKNQLDGTSTGYQVAIFHNAQLFRAFEGGLARTGADSPGRSMSVSDRLELGSVSKTINAMATIKALATKGKTVDEPIAPYVPSGWTQHGSINNLTFRDLLAHTSGLPDWGTIDPQDYTPGKINAGCKAALATGVVQGDGYNNINYELLRVLVPYVVDSQAMAAAEGDEATHEQTLAACFVALVRQHVFQPAGLGNNVYLHDYHPSGNAFNYAMYYDFAQPDAAGVAAENRDLRPGRGGWKMSASQLAQVLAAWETGYVLSPTLLETMKEGNLGIFKDTANGGFPAFWKHNGKSHSGNKAGHAQICAFPNNVQVALLVNSANNTHGNRTVLLRDAWIDACQFPDLIVSSFTPNGGVQYLGSSLKVPFSMTVTNQGQASSRSTFINGVRQGTAYRWNGFMQELAPGEQKTVNGVASIPDPSRLLAGKTVRLIAFTDAPIAGGDTSIPAIGRVKETNEGNNVNKFIDIVAPQQFGFGNQVNPGLPNRPLPPSVITPRPTGPVHPLFPPRPVGPTRPVVPTHPIVPTRPTAPPSIRIPQQPTTQPAPRVPQRLPVPSAVEQDDQQAPPRRVLRPLVPARPRVPAR